MSHRDESPTAYSPTGSAEYSEVPTVPLNPAEHRLIQDYMTRRQHFLSDYERYNPVQNMHALANHVFDLTEGIYAMKDQIGDVRSIVKEEMVPFENEVARQGRLIDFVSSQQKELGEGMKGLGKEVETMGSEVTGMGITVSGLGQKVGNVEQQLGNLGHTVGTMGQEINGLKQDVAGLGNRMDSLEFRMNNMQNDVDGLKRDMSGLRSDVEGLKDNVQQGFAEIKALMMASFSARAQVCIPSSPTFPYTNRVIRDNFSCLNRGIPTI